MCVNGGRRPERPPLRSGDGPCPIVIVADGAQTGQATDGEGCMGEAQAGEAQVAGGNAGGAETLLPCDVIFRGGITSGVVYPGFVRTLARKYRFRSVGGASAGAIAAALTAAAEYGRQRSEGLPPNERFAPFDRLAATASDVGGRPGNVTSLKRLLTPVPRLVLLSKVVALAAGLVAGTRRLRRGAGWFWRLVAFAAAVALVLLAWHVPGLGAAVIGATLASLAWLWWEVFRELPKAGFGLCAGSVQRIGLGPSPRRNVDILRRRGALSDWLHGEIQRAAGRGVTADADKVAEADVRPLTAGELRQSDIQLVLTTTNLSQRIPHSFPFLEKGRGRLFFRPEELRRVLPADVVAWMVLKGRERPADGAPVADGFVRLPEPADLPVVFGVRLSLSFPGLLSAVKLYAHNNDRPLNRDGTVTPDPVWFSDGGITSNFPIHLFDAPLPRHPTFCITLRGATEEELHGRRTVTDTTRWTVEDESTEDPLVRMPRSNERGGGARFGRPIGSSLGAFVAAILDTARNAHENELMLMPGHRDRIVHVLTLPDEGGLNLSMPPDVIRRLSDRGAHAAEELIRRFHPEAAKHLDTGIELDWENHRWVRLRATAAALERYLAAFERGWSARPEGYGDDLLYDRMIERDPPSYPWPDDHTRFTAERLIGEIRALARTIEARAAGLAQANGLGLDDVSVFDGLGFASGRPRCGAPEPPQRLRLGGMDNDPAARRPHVSRWSTPPPVA